MIGMDRLTDELLEAYAAGKWKSYERDNIEMARELLAHRRASQAAPAPQKPVAWAETDHKGKVIGVSMNQYPWHPTPLYAQAAPAPSDGMREARKEVAALTRWSPKGLPKNRGGVCMGVGKHGEWISRKEVLTILSASSAQEGEPRHD